MLLLGGTLDSGENLKSCVFLVRRNGSCDCTLPLSGNKQNDLLAHNGRGELQLIVLIATSITALALIQVVLISKRVEGHNI